MSYPQLTQQTAKIRNHTKHLLDAFLALKAKYALYESLMEKHSSKVRKDEPITKTRGYLILRFALFFSCVQDCANLILENSDSCPSMKKIIEMLQRKELKEKLQNDFSYREDQFPLDTPYLTEALQEMEKKATIRRMRDFDQKCHSIITAWESLRDSQKIKNFKTLRDKHIAHSELKLEKDEYLPAVNISLLNLTWHDIGPVIKKMEIIILDLYLIVRNTSYSMESFDRPLRRDTKDFWK